MQSVVSLSGIDATTERTSPGIRRRIFEIYATDVAYLLRPASRSFEIAASTLQRNFPFHCTSAPIIHPLAFFWSGTCLSTLVRPQG